MLIYASYSVVPRRRRDTHPHHPSKHTSPITSDASTPLLPEIDLSLPAHLRHTPSHETTAYTASSHSGSTSSGPPSLQKHRSDFAGNSAYSRKSDSQETLAIGGRSRYWRRSWMRGLGYSISFNLDLDCDAAMQCQCSAYVESDEQHEGTVRNILIHDTRVSI